MKVEPIPMPEVAACPAAFVSGEEEMYIGGTAIPNSQVLVFFKKDGKLIKRWEVVADERGEWFLVEGGLFRSGLYQITAITRDTRGAISQEATLCFIRVIFSGIAIGPLIISYRALAPISLALFILVLAGVLYLLRTLRRARRLVEKETEDLKQKFYKEYEELRKDIERDLKELKKARGKRKVTEAEKEREKELLKNLADLKEVFEKEIKDLTKWI